MKYRFYSVEQLGKKRSLTPEGFLICEDVPISRTGTMMYGPDELPIDGSKQGYVKIKRDAADLFNETTIASFMGKAVTINHPEEDVNPNNWHDLSVGVVHNVRRGVGIEDDLLLADLFITNKDVIAQLSNDLIEVSAGYDADYEETGPGEGAQTNIVGNHVALVESGRCGPRCSVRDSDDPSLVVVKKELHMKLKKKGFTLDALLRRIRKATKDEDPEALEAALAEAEEGGVTEDDALPEAADPGDIHVHIHNGAAETLGTTTVEDEVPPADEKKGTYDDELGGRIDALEAGHTEILAQLAAISEKLGGGGGSTDDAENEELKEEMKKEDESGATNDAAFKFTDSAFLSKSFRDTMSKAEILVPGIRVPTYDAKAPAHITFRKICGTRRTALDLAYAQPATRSVIDDVLDGKHLDTHKMTCDAVRQAFDASVLVQKRSNNHQSQHSGSQPAKQAGATITSISDLNKANSQFWADK
jgi:hypothetical protein